MEAKTENKDGIHTAELKTWRHFGEFISQNINSLSDYIWRGQACDALAPDAWKLESSLDRRYNKGMWDPLHKKTVGPGYDPGMHLEAFKKAVRGRRGPNPPQLDDDGYLALGQHYGLATPLLDWTRSPFVALFFAFTDEKKHWEKNTVYALHEPSIEMKSDEIEKRLMEIKSKGPPAFYFDKVVRIIYPMMDENQRLINQAGLFTKIPYKTDLESWIKENFKNEQKGILIRVVIPDIERDECLTYLNRMNINHLTLFPDINGAAKYVNTLFEVRGYDSIWPYKSDSEDLPGVLR